MMNEHNHDHQHQHDHTDHDDPEAMEMKHFQKVLLAFLYYRSHSLNYNHRRRRDFLALPEHHKRLVPEQLEKIDLMDTKIEANTRLFRDIVKHSNIFSSNDVAQLCDPGKGRDIPVKPSDMDKVRSTLKQFFRDWSSEGKQERDTIYLPVIEQLHAAFATVPVENRGDVRVLVPGAGLGRLAYDIAAQGYSCQGNEFTYFMLLASNFILNNVAEKEQYETYPFIHSFSNLPSAASQLTPVRIPDIVPGNLPAGTDFSMVAGDFLEVYGTPESQGTWDCVVTCFFIDTAHNIIEYMELIHGLLKPGGTWINIGPLLYHFEDIPGEASVELSLDQVKRVAKDLGFEFQNESTLDTTYTSNPESMLTYLYRSAFWTAKCKK
ncbi:N2227-domain-containing protein [Hesseltinella vesiculosa]|uniref:carnosine N-methyltransferase n=1 Tax=Hesseltinella vesiculosa TaxID=101127 RepID=A0A1X2G5X5_9FUNG|nr:N2227-domain-containing protein [Hesseltinella vesiculosa]